MYLFLKVKNLNFTAIKRMNDWQKNLLIILKSLYALFNSILYSFSNYSIKNNIIL